jgi:hypothetical protein
VRSRPYVGAPRPLDQEPGSALAATKLCPEGRLAQLGERLPYKQEVAGSSPAPPTRRIPLQRGSPVAPPPGWSATRYRVARSGRRWKIGLAAAEDEPDGLCDSTELSPSLTDAALRPAAPRGRVPCLRARRRTDAELCTGHRRKRRADRLHLGSILDSRRGRRREARCLAAGDVRLHPPLARASSLAFVPRVVAVSRDILSQSRGPLAGKELRLLRSTLASRGGASRLCG